MAFATALFGSLSGVPERAKTALVVGGGAIAGLAAAAYVTPKVAELLPESIRDYAPVVPFLGAIVSAIALQRFSPRFALGVSAGMAAYGIWGTANAIPFIKDNLIAKLPADVKVPLAGLGSAVAPISYFTPRFSGAAMTVETLRGAPLQVDTLGRSPTTIEELRGGFNAATVG